MTGATGVEIMILVTKTIKDIEFVVEIPLNSKLCILNWNGNPFFFEDVDLATVIRAVKNSEDYEDLIDNLKGIWREEKIIAIIKSFALDEIDAEDFLNALFKSDNWTQRKINTISLALREMDSETGIWFKYRAMMYDCVMESRVME